MNFASKGGAKDSCTDTVFASGVLLSDASVYLKSIVNIKFDGSGGA